MELKGSYWLVAACVAFTALLLVTASIVSARSAAKARKLNRRKKGKIVLSVKDGQGDSQP